MVMIQSIIKPLFMFLSSETVLVLFLFSCCSDEAGYLEIT